MEKYWHYKDELIGKNKTGTGYYYALTRMGIVLKADTLTGIKKLITQQKQPQGMTRA